MPTKMIKYYVDPKTLFFIDVDVESAIELQKVVESIAAGDNQIEHTAWRVWRKAYESTNRPMGMHALLLHSTVFTLSASMSLTRYLTNRFDNWNKKEE